MSRHRIEQLLHDAAAALAQIADLSCDQPRIEQAAAGIAQLYPGSRQRIEHILDGGFRLLAIEDALPAAKPRIKRLTETLLPQHRSGDFAQALMDLGATICSPKKPACALCPWNEPCLARARGDQKGFPRKARKREGKLRRGAAFVALRADGRVLLRQRPEKGLLGSMTEVPGSEWTHDFEIATALAAAPRLRAKPKWQKLAGVVTHVFTHFPLELTVFVAQVPRATKAMKGAHWVRLADLPGEALPNVMRKVLSAALKLD